jgi:cysteine-rich repeat protein
MRTYAWLGGMAVVALGFWACGGGSDTTPTTTTGTTSVGGGGSGHGGGGTGGTTTGGTGGVGGGPAVCGNGVQEAGEECDDGNTDDQDGCEHDCTLAKCGNGIVDPGEVCWGGAMVDLDLPTMAVGRILATDCDGDGDQDVLVIGEVDETSSLLVVLTNDGTGTLTAAAPLSWAGGRPQGFALGQLDNIAGADLVVSDFPVLQVLRGNGDCTFTVAQDLSLNGAQGTGVAIATLDNDAIEDFVSLTLGPPPLLAYHLSTESPTLLHSIQAGSSNATDIISGAIDGNGTPGIVYTDFGADKVVLRNVIPTVPFGAAAVFPPNAATTGSGPVAVALGDVDGDGEPDILTANFAGDSVTVLRNDGSGSFLLDGADISVVGDGPIEGHSPSRILLVDVDGDGDLDVLTANRGDPADPQPTPTITLLLNDGAGNFTIATSTLFPLVEKSFPIELAHTATDFAVVDLNHDGELDLVMTTLVSNSSPEESHVTVLLANP